MSSDLNNSASRASKEFKAATPDTQRMSPTEQQYQQMLFKRHHQFHPSHNSMIMGDAHLNGNNLNFVGNGVQGANNSCEGNGAQAAWQNFLHANQLHQQQQQQQQHRNPEAQQAHMQQPYASIHPHSFPTSNLAMTSNMTNDMNLGHGSHNYSPNICTTTLNAGSPALLHHQHGIGFNMNAGSSAAISSRNATPQPAQMYLDCSYGNAGVPQIPSGLPQLAFHEHGSNKGVMVQQQHQMQFQQQLHHFQQPTQQNGSFGQGMDTTEGSMGYLFSFYSVNSNMQDAELSALMDRGTISTPQQPQHHHQQQPQQKLLGMMKTHQVEFDKRHDSFSDALIDFDVAMSSSASASASQSPNPGFQLHPHKLGEVSLLKSLPSNNNETGSRNCKGRKGKIPERGGKEPQTKKQEKNGAKKITTGENKRKTTISNKSDNECDAESFLEAKCIRHSPILTSNRATLLWCQTNPHSEKNKSKGESSSQTPLHLSCTAGSSNPFSRDSISLKTVTSRRNVGVTPSTVENGVKNTDLPSPGASFVATEDIFEDDLSVEALNSLQSSRKSGRTLRDGLDPDQKLFSGIEHETLCRKGIGGHGVANNTPTFKNDSSSSIEEDNDAEKTKNTVKKKKKLTTESCKNIESTKLAYESLPNKPKTATDSGTANPKVKPSSKVSTEICHPNRSCGPIELVSCSANDAAIKREKNVRSRKPPSKCNKKVIFGGPASETPTNAEAVTTETNQTTSRLLPTMSPKSGSNVSDTWHGERSRTMTIISGNKLITPVLVRGIEASSKSKRAKVKKDGNKHKDGKRAQVLPTDGRKAKCSNAVVSVDKKNLSTVWNLSQSQSKNKPAEVDRLADPECSSTASKSAPSTFKLAGYPSSKPSIGKDENSHPCQLNSSDNCTQNNEAKISTEKLRLSLSLINEGAFKQRDGVASNTDKVKCIRQNQETSSIKCKQHTPGEETTCNRPLESRTTTTKSEENCMAYIHTGTDTNSLKNAIHSKSASSQCEQLIGSQESNCLVAAYTEESVLSEKNGNRPDNNETRGGKVGNVSSKPKRKNTYQRKFCKNGIGRGGQPTTSNGCEDFREKTRLAQPNLATHQKLLSSAAKQVAKEIGDNETKYRCFSDSNDVLLSDLQIPLNTDSISNGNNNCMNKSNRHASFTHTDVAQAKNVASDTPTCMPQIDGSARTETFPVSFLCRTVCEKNELKTPLSYPYAPMGQLWLDGALNSKKCVRADDGKNLDLKLGGTLIGRRWVWDEGYYGDGHLDMGLGRIFQLMNQSSNATLDSRPFPIGCTCGADHLSLKESDMKRWNLKTDVATSRATRRSERSSSSTRMSNVVSQLADGRLNPHTLITCEDYSWGPEFRFLKNIQTESVQPFSVRVSPDVTFLADLHSHLCDSEIIGFLGGYYSMEEKCIYIQAAFPCKSTSRLDSGHTDVEMDPISQIHAREAIANHGMSVVGWYHSHPTFQPDPSVTDIENQASYQQLFTKDSDSQNLSYTDSNSVIDCYSSSDDDSTHAEEKCPHYRRAGFISPFVGLIVGTYDAKNPSSQSVMRWFHVTSKYTEHGKFVNFPMNLKTTNRHFRKFTDKTNGEELEHVRSDMSEKSVRIRNELESIYLACPLTDFSQLASPENDLTTFRKQTLKESQHSTLATNLERQRAEGDITSTGQNHTNVDSIEGGDTDLSRNKIIDNNDRSIVSADQPKKTTSPSTEEVKGQTHSIECRGALFLTEELFEIDQQADISTAKTSQPLFFTEVERSILGLKPEDVSFDVIGGVIWLAVEREQHINFQSSSCQDSVSMATKNPTSSRSILEHLLRHSFSGNDSFDRKIYEMIQCIGESGSAILGEETNVKDSDAAITHSVDVVLSHYASIGTRFDPFGTWSGAGDKGLISNKDSASTSSESDSWKDYYFTKVLGMYATKLSNGVVEYSGGSKMKRGHKLAACLLKWASFMQLSPGFESSSKQSRQFSYDIARHENGLEFDHERKLIECGNDVLNNTTSQTTGELDYIYFVAEVMRLLAARWREARGTPAKRTRPTSTPPKRGRPASENPIAQGRKRGRGRPRKVQASNPGNEANIVKRGRGRPRKTENRVPGRPKTSDASGN